MAHHHILTASFRCVYVLYNIHIWIHRYQRMNVISHRTHQLYGFSQQTLCHIYQKIPFNVRLLMAHPARSGSPDSHQHRVNDIQKMLSLFGLWGSCCCCCLLCHHNLYVFYVTHAHSFCSLLLPILNWRRGWVATIDWMIREFFFFGSVENFWKYPLPLRVCALLS